MNILVWGWMSVLILNYTDVIHFPRKNLFTDSDLSFLSKGGSSGGGDDGLGYLFLFIVL